LLARAGWSSSICLLDSEPPRRSSGPSTLNEDQIAERGARMARRDDREYREYLREEQRSQPGCPAREVVLDQRGRATSAGDQIHDMDSHADESHQFGSLSRSTDRGLPQKTS